MKFDLNPDLEDLLIYGMENQDLVHVLDTHTLKVVPQDSLDLSVVEEDDRIISLPSWKSVDGFQLMENFTAGLHNPLFREELSAILQSGRGVFRQFKNALKSRPDMERLWFSWKQREMRRRIREWYNGLREVWGLEPLAWEEKPDQDTSDLILWDFEFRNLAPEETARVPQWDRDFFDESYASLSESERHGLYQRLRWGVPLPGHVGGSRVLGVFTPGGEIAGLAWYCVFETHVELIQLGVFGDYRSLGIARALLGALAKDPGTKNPKGDSLPLWCSLPQSAAFLAHHLGAWNAQPLFQCLRGQAN